MPEQQASPSSPQPSLAHGEDHRESPGGVLVSPSASFRSLPSTGDIESSKRTYLSLLPPPHLIDLILAIDANRQALIFPHDLDSAIKALQRPQRQSQPLSPRSIAAVPGLVKAEPTSSATPPPPPPSQTLTQTHALPVQSPVVQPPQYKPPPKQPLHMYPYTHTPYYPPQPHESPSLPPPSGPSRHVSLFTSAPLTRDLNKPPIPRPTPPPQVSSRDDPNAMPSYEEMIVEAIVDVGDGEGTPPKILFAWMASHYPLQQNFRPSASQALHKALKRGRLEKIGGKYRLNPSWGGGPTTSKRATRRPTAFSGIAPPASHPHHASGPPTVPPGYPPMHPGYNYPTFPHPPGIPHPYHPAYAPNGMAWGPGHPQPYPQAASGTDLSIKADEMETDDGGESEDAEATRTSILNEMVAEEVADDRMKEKIKLSLVRLARVLKRFAKKGEGTEGDS